MNRSNRRNEYCPRGRSCALTSSWLGVLLLLLYAPLIRYYVLGWSWHTCKPAQLTSLNFFVLYMAHELSAHGFRHHASILNKNDSSQIKRIYKFVCVLATVLAMWKDRCWTNLVFLWWPLLECFAMMAYMSLYPDETKRNTR